MNNLQGTNLKYTASYFVYIIHLIFTYYIAMKCLQKWVHTPQR